MSFLKEEEVVSLGPDPVLNLLPKGGDIGKTQVDLIIVCFLFFRRGAFLSHKVNLHLVIGIENEPKLDDFFPMLFSQSADGFWEGVVIHQPVGVVNSMYGHEVPTVMRFPLMQHHGQDSVIGFGDRDAIVGVGEENFGGNVELPVMFCPLLLHQFESLKMKYEAFRLSVKILSVGFIRPRVEQGLEVYLVDPWWEDDVEWDLFPFF